MGNKLYVGNLSFRVTSEDLQEHFGAAGAVETTNSTKSKTRQVVRIVISVLRRKSASPFGFDRRAEPLL